MYQGNLYVSIFWLSLGLGGIGISMGIGWAATTDLGRNFLWVQYQVDELMG